MCEQMGWEPSEEEMPIDASSLETNAQYALILLNVLPDKWEGMSGSWMGKDYSGLAAIMDIYEIDDRREVFELLKVAEDELGKYYRQKQKEQEGLAKAKRAK
jgi:hypothetical protein